MDTTPKSRRDRRRRRRLLAILMSAMAIGTATTTALSLALFTASTTVGANNFTTGTIVIGTNPATALLSAPAMMPGDTVNGTLVVQNNGTAQLRYAMTSSSTNTDTKALRDQITLTVKTADAGGGCTAFTGTSLYTGALSAAAFGSTAQGNQPGDRTLAGGAPETLCFRATLPIGTTDGFQGAATVTTFTFSAEQTANNP